MKPRKRPLPASFLEEWRFVPPSLRPHRQSFERFYNAGLDESREVLRELYEAAADRMLFPPGLLDRVKDVLGDEKLVAPGKPKTCAICAKSRSDLFQERLNGKLCWVCTNCTVLSSGDSRYRFDESPPSRIQPLGAKGRNEG